MQFKIEGGVNPDGSWRINVVVPNGETVTGGDVEELLFVAMCHYRSQRGARLPTVAEVEAIARQADLGVWIPTQAGISVQVAESSLAHFRTYTNGTETRTAPCAADGSPLPTTLPVLSAVPRAPEPTPEA